MAAAPVTLPATLLTGLAIAGTVSVGYGTYSNYQAYSNGTISKDEFDFNSGEMLGGLAVPEIAAHSGATLGRGPYSVYGGTDSAGDLRYVGITKRAPEVRFAEHGRAVGTGRDTLDFETIQSGLSRAAARGSEQKYITNYGVQRNGGQLLNKVNSIGAGGSSGGTSLQSLLNGLSALVAQLSAVVTQLTKAK